MTAQPIRGTFQFTSQTAQHQEEIIKKLNELSAGIGVGANYYPGGAEQLRVRFGDHRHGISHVVLAPQDIALVRAYMDHSEGTGENPAFAKARALFAQADDALLRAQDYVREQADKRPPKAAPRAFVA